MRYDSTDASVMEMLGSPSERFLDALHLGADGRGFASTYMARYYAEIAVKERCLALGLRHNLVSAQGDSYAQLRQLAIGTLGIGKTPVTPVGVVDCEGFHSLAYWVHVLIQLARSFQYNVGYSDEQLALVLAKNLDASFKVNMRYWSDVFSAEETSAYFSRFEQFVLHVNTLV